MNYNTAMMQLNRAIYQAIASGNKERRNVSALKEMAADIDHLIDFGCTRDELRDIIQAKHQWAKEEKIDFSEWDQVEENLNSSNEIKPEDEEIAEYIQKLINTKIWGKKASKMTNEEGNT